jgi:PAS domain-containing protein
MMSDLIDPKISAAEQQLMLEIKNIKGELLSEKQKNFELEKLLGAFRSLLTSVPGLAYLLDLEGNLLAFNETVREALNRPPDKMLGSNIFEIPNSVMTNELLAAFQYVVQTGGGIRLTNQIEATIYDNYLQPILGQNSSINSVAVFSSDIKHYENEKKTLEEL